MTVSGKGDDQVSTIRIRGLHEDDLPALLNLCRHPLTFDVFSLSLLRRRVLEEPLRNPAYQLTAWDGERLAGAMLGGVRQVGEERVAWLRLFAAVWAVLPVAS